MIARLSGTVLEIEDKAFIVDVTGVGYRVTVLKSLVRKVHVGQDIVLRIFHHVSADNEGLFGFVSADDRRYFELLLSVPSVGPRTAMSILDVAPPKTLAKAVATEDVKLLTKVSGVGRKTAERILVELKGKFESESSAGLVGEMHEEVMSALLHLGYTKAQARTVVLRLPDSVNTVEEAVKMVLQSQGADA